MNLLEKMKFSIDTMTMGKKLFASIQVTVLGIVIVFAALAILYFSITIMEKSINNSKKTVKKVESRPGIDETIDLDHEEAVHSEDEDIMNDTELVAVITAAIATSLHVPVQDVVIRGIKHVQDPTPIWARVGRMEQINNML